MKNVWESFVSTGRRVLAARLLMLFFIFFSIASLTSCKSVWDYIFGHSSNSKPDNTNEPEKRLIEPTSKFSLAIGGVAFGRDELVIYDDEGNIMDLEKRSLNCLTSESIVQFDPRPGFDSIAAGSGVLIVATAPGVTEVTCLVDGVPLSEKYEVTISPQNLIQILVAEAGSQLADEATADEGAVELTSKSPTGDTVGAAIRNRIDLIEANSDPSLFNANSDAYYSDPIASYYDSVIEASGQFAPTNLADGNHQIYSDAQDRNFLDESWRLAYDQAVLTAAAIYNGDTSDPVGDAFAFLSPTSEQWAVISNARLEGALLLPDGCGVSDDNFPAFAPLQIVVLDGIWTHDDGRPAFIFIRHREIYDPAVIKLP